jgi:hypothetical protein
VTAVSAAQFGGTNNFDGYWSGAGTLTGGNFNTGFSADAWAEYCGDFTISFEVRGGELRGLLKMDGEVASEFSVRGQVLADGSLEDARAEGAFEIKFYGTHERGYWEVETCRGTYVVRRGASRQQRAQLSSRLGPLKSGISGNFGGAKRFDGHWRDTGTLTGGKFNTGFSADAWAEYCGDFTLSFDVRGGKLKGTLKMDGDVASEFSVRGRILVDGSLEDARAEGAFEIKLSGTHERGNWELETCRGTYAARRGMARQ